MIKYFVILSLLSVAFYPKYILAENYIFMPDSLNANKLSAQKFNKENIDSWLGVDKAAHIAGSCMITVAMSEGLNYLAGYSDNTSKQFGVSVAFSMGLGKEIHDSLQSNNSFSYKDIIADIVGILVGIMLVSVE